MTTGGVSRAMKLPKPVQRRWKSNQQSIHFCFPFQPSPAQVVGKLSVRPDGRMVLLPLQPVLPVHRRQINMAACSGPLTISRIAGWAEGNSHTKRSARKLFLNGVTLHHRLRGR